MAVSGDERVAMKPERWGQVDHLLQSALALLPQERSAFLSQACGDDESLRSEVESLIASHDDARNFLEVPISHIAADLILPGRAGLAAGQKLSQYKIIRSLGAGGMGEVYLAEDPKLGRRIALKLLPGYLMNDQNRLRRFRQEARAASALNHPNILTVYEVGQVDGTEFMVTEYVEGETLRARMARTPLSISEVLDVAIQVASGLSAAHEAGIIHRDIKPENIMLRKGVLAKILDFGLAKLAEPPAFAADKESTLAQVNTTPGLIMGTANYMSPEQARGGEVDERTDVFSLGAVVYEMIAGRGPFDGETTTDVISLLLQKEPVPLVRLAPEVPAELARIVTKALRKDREERYQVVKDMMLDLKSLKEELEFKSRLERSAAPEFSGTGAPISERTTSLLATDRGSGLEVNEQTRTTVGVKSERLITTYKVISALGVLALIGLAFVLYQLWRRNLSENQQTGSNAAETAVVLSTTQITNWPGLDVYPSLSPEGNAVAYSSDHGGSFEIYVKLLTPGARELQLTSDGQQNFQPAWSPDGKLIAYFSEKRHGIWIVPATGGAERQLTEFGSNPAWSPDGSLIAFQSSESVDLAATGGFGALPPSTLWIIPARGGDAKQITPVGKPPGGHGAPSWSPDGKRIVFVATDGSSNTDAWNVSAEGTDLKQVTRQRLWIYNPIYSPDGEHVYYGGVSKSGNFVLYELPVSKANGEAVGEAVEIANTGLARIKHLTISASGKKLAYGAPMIRGNISSVSVSPASGKALGAPAALTQDTSLRKATPLFSPDGRKIAYTQFSGGTNQDIWVMDADGSNPTQLTTDPAIDCAPSWFPDNDLIAFQSDRGGRPAVWTISLQSRRERVLADLGADLGGWPRVSPDGKMIVFNSTKSGTINVWVVPVEGGTPAQLTFDRELAGFACWSPDGKFLAFEIKRGNNDSVFIMSADGGASEQLTFDSGLSWPMSFSPDGDRIVFAGFRNGIWNIYWISRTTKQQQQVTNYTKLNTFVRYPSWSPSGDHIVYEYAETTGNVWVIDLK
jgi:eukaryotic-like serine/threonine-protein kinase